MMKYWLNFKAFILGLLIIISLKLSVSFVSFYKLCNVMFHLNAFTQFKQCKAAGSQWKRELYTQAIKGNMAKNEIFSYAKLIEQISWLQFAVNIICLIISAWAIYRTYKNFTMKPSSVQ